MRKPTKIVTDPREMTRICLRQPRVTRERAITSILAQNGYSPAQIERRLESLAASRMDKAENRSR